MSPSRQANRMDVLASDDRSSPAVIPLYRCDTAFGHIILSARFPVASMQPRNLVQSLLISALFEPLLQQLEERLETGLELHALCREQAPEHVSVPAAGTTAQALRLLCQPDDNPIVDQLIVDFPARAWPHLQNRAVLDNWPMRLEAHFASVPACLQISQTDLTVAEMDKLSPGALLLLPESFTTSWTSQLNVLDGELQLHGRIQRDEAKWTLTGHHIDCADAGSTTPGCRLWCPITIDPTPLLQQGMEPSLSLPCPLMDTHWQLDTVDGPSFSGQLMPVAHGLGCLIQRVLASNVTYPAAIPRWT